MDLIEREHVMSALTAIVDAAADGNGGIGVVVAPAGGGKTSVLTSINRVAAARGVDVLAAAGVEQETVIPYGVVHRLVDPLVRRRPELVSSGPAARAWDTLESGAADLSVVRGLHWLIADRAEIGPVLILIDDLQWVDRPSAAFVDYLANRITPSRVALIVASRDPATTLNLLGATRPVRLELHPLTLAGVGAVALARLGRADDDEVEALHRATGGSPFLVHEALTVMGEDRDLAPDQAVSADLVAAVQRRLRALDPPARRVVEALAVLGPSQSTDTVAEVAGLDPAATRAAGDRLAAAHLTSDMAFLTIRHPLVRSALLETMAPGRRFTLHRRSADALARRDGSVMDVGQHLLATHPATDAAVAAGLIDAGRAALAHGDPETARLLLERAGSEPPPASARGQLALHLGETYRRLGDERAVVEMRRAFDLADTAGQRVAALRGLLGALLAAGRLVELDEAMAGLLVRATDGDQDAAAAVEADLLSAARHAIHASLWNADRLRRWSGRVTGRTAAERVLLANLATQAALDGQAAGRTAELARAALRGHQIITEQTADSLTVYQPIWQLTAAEALDDAESALGAAFADARARGSVVGYALASLFASYVDLGRGDVDRAEANATAAMDAAEQLPSQWMVLPAIVAGVVDVRLERDEVAEALSLLERHRLTGPLPDGTPYRLLLYSRARLHDAAGRADDAVSDAEELLGRQRAANVLSSHLVPGAAIAALARAQRGDMAAARRHAQENLRLATRWGSPRVVGRALVVEARVQPPDAAVHTLDLANEHLTRSPARLDLGWAEHDRGVTLARLGQKAGAAAALRSALDIAAGCGATALERSSRAILVHLGFRPRRAALTGLDALTAGERQVADLAAQGRSNRDIAASLFVTPRTVETHLTSTYRKLGIAGRTELAAALDQKSGGSSREKFSKNTNSATRKTGAVTR